MTSQSQGSEVRQAEKKKSIIKGTKVKKVKESGDRKWQQEVATGSGDKLHKHHWFEKEMQKIKSDTD